MTEGRTKLAQVRQPRRMCIGQRDTKGVFACRRVRIAKVTDNL